MKLKYLSFSRQEKSPEDFSATLADSIELTINIFIFTFGATAPSFRNNRRDFEKINVMINSYLNNLSRVDNEDFFRCCT